SGRRAEPVARVKILRLRNDLETAIIDLLRARGNRLLGVRDIFERLALRDVTQEHVAIAVDDLENDGVILPVRGKRYSLLEFTPYAAGAVRVHPDGYGTIYGGGGDQPDIYIDRRVMKGAMNGDLVIVRVDRKNPQFQKLRQRKLIVGEV